MGMFDWLFGKKKAAGPEAPVPGAGTAQPVALVPAAPEPPALSPAEVLVSRLRTANYDARHMVFSEIVLKAGPTAVDALLAALDKNWVRDVPAEHQSGVRVHVIMALGRIGDTRAVPGLLTLLAQDADDVVRSCAALNLAKLRDPRAVEPMLRALEDKEASVRHAATEGLTEMGEKRAIAPLQKMLHDSSERNRRAAAKALDSFGVPAVDPSRPCCLRCGGDVLTVKGLVTAAQELGMAVVDDTVIVLRSDARRGEQLEARKGFQCAACRRVFCMGCILQVAPPHQNGGKACIDCLGNYARLNFESTRWAAEKAEGSLGVAQVATSKPCCLRCEGEVLTVKELVTATREAGMDVVDDTVIARRTEAHKGEQLEARKGFRCTRCSRIYCLGCILRAAPPHRNGGKACFECRTNYERLN